MFLSILGLCKGPAHMIQRLSLCVAPLGANIIERILMRQKQMLTLGRRFHYDLLCSKVIDIMPVALFCKAVKRKRPWFLETEKDVRFHQEHSIRLETITQEEKTKSPVP